MILLIHTLGNRDLQFPKEVGIPSGFARKYLADNTEKGAEDFLVIRKSGEKKEPSFRDVSRKIQDEIRHGKHKEIFTEALRFPMLEQVCRYVLTQKGQIDRLILCTTLQTPPHGQDTDLVAEMARDYFRREKPQFPGLKEIRIEYMNIAPYGRGRDESLRYFHEMIEEQKTQGFDQLYISHNQGLPTATRALDFLGLFQDYTYLSIHPQNGVSVVDNAVYESILSELIKDRLGEIIREASLGKG
ncbi:MAG: hypothetical protein R3B93_20995 [Bacteroidia bacterium]